MQSRSFHHRVTVSAVVLLASLVGIGVGLY
jgi:hypothetical protein